MKNKRKYQAERILDLLSGYLCDCSLSFTDGWVKLPAIMRLGIACHTRRIHELRKAGRCIEIRKEYVDGQLKTSYRLVP